MIYILHKYSKNVANTYLNLNFCKCNMMQKMHSSNLKYFLWFWFSYCSIIHGFEFFESDEPVTESGEIRELNFGNLDVRVGRVSWVDVHWNDVKYFQMKVNFNNSLELGCVTSNLATYLKTWDFKNRLCLFIVNVKPLLILNVMSEAFLLVTRIDDWWLNIIDPPEGATEGDIVFVDGYELDPVPLIDTEKSNFRNVMARMRVNENGVLTYNNISLNVGGIGPATTENLNNIGLKDMF